tara:strand:+ start:724 stop:1431 length:708 start_codon:yes stop_codon:yes gene_type:complete
MALPKLTTPEYTLTLPSTGEEIKYRPFLVKEQKLLMIANESEDEKQILDAMTKLVSDCTFGTIDANINPMFDVEYVFLHIRKQAVGSKLDLTLTCPDDGITQVPVSIDLDDVGVQMTVEHSMETKLTEDIAVSFRYPLLKDVQGIPLNVSDFERVLTLLISCVETVTNGEEVHERVDMSNKEIEEFVESFSSKQLEDVLKFFEDMPKLRHVIDVVNPKTNIKSEVLLEGIESFLE